jgi:flagellar biosynthesis protein FlhF
MRIKSYFADSINEAMEQARRELGPEALLMDSKKTELELRSLGAYEVVFAVAPEEVRPAGIVRPFKTAPAAVAISAAPIESQGGINDFSRELAELRKQIETVKRSVDHRPDALPKGTSLSVEGTELVARLTAAEISEGLAFELVAAAEVRRSQEEPITAGLDAALRAECEQRLRFSPSLGLAGAEPRIVLLAGPAGTGKTTTLVKLALRYGLRARQPLQLLSLDTLRIGGWEQLACYARIAGLPCQPVHTPAALDQAFVEFSQKKLLLIDTPGFSPGDEAQSRSLAAWLASHRAFVEVQLVLSAAARPSSNLAAIERFAPFAPSKLLFTHLDEVDSNGPAIETALRSHLPISFLANGQQVPEDIEEASLDRVLGSLVASGQGSRRIASAA